MSNVWRRGINCYYHTIGGTVGSVYCRGIDCYYHTIGGTVGSV